MAEVPPTAEVGELQLPTAVKSTSVLLDHPKSAQVRHTAASYHSDLTGNLEVGGRKSWRRGSDTRPAGLSSEDDVPYAP